MFWHLIFQHLKSFSRFRCGCHGLHVDTGRFNPVGQKVDREQRFCLVCASGTAEDEHHFLFDCPAYCSIRDRFTAIVWGPAPTMSSFFALHDPRVIAKFLHECTQVHVARGCFRGAAALVAVFHLQLSDKYECTKNNLIICLFLCFSSDYWSNGHGWPNNP